MLAKALVPVDGNAQTIGKARLLFPAEFAQLGAINSVTVVIKWPVVCVLDPLLEFLWGVVLNANLLQEVAAQIQVGDLIVRADIVDVANLTLVQNSVKGISSVASKQVAPGWAAITVKNDGLSAVEQACEFGDDLCKRLLATGFICAQYRFERQGPR